MPARRPEAKRELRNQNRDHCKRIPRPARAAPGAMPHSSHVDIAALSRAIPQRVATALKNPGAKIDKEGVGSRAGNGENQKALNPKMARRQFRLSQWQYSIMTVCDSAKSALPAHSLLFATLPSRRAGGSLVDQQKSAFEAIRSDAGPHHSGLSFSELMPEAHLLAALHGPGLMNCPKSMRAHVDQAARYCCWRVNNGQVHCSLRCLSRLTPFLIR